MTAVKNETEATIGGNPEVAPCHVCGDLGVLDEVATDHEFVWACPACAEAIAASLKAKAEAAICPACHGKGKDDETTCFYCEGSGKEPANVPTGDTAADTIAVHIPANRMPSVDIDAPLTNRTRDALVDLAQARIRGIYELDQQIVGKVDALDEVRRRMKAVTAALVMQGLPGKNEKEREAGLTVLLSEEKEYPDLMQQERQLHTELEQLRLTKDYLRRMHHLELALLQGDKT